MFWGGVGWQGSGVMKAGEDEATDTQNTQEELVHAQVSKKGPKLRAPENMSYLLALRKGLNQMGRVN